jgi:hypothetical protein
MLGLYSILQETRSEPVQQTAGIEGRRHPGVGRTHGLDLLQGRALGGGA